MSSFLFILKKRDVKTPAVNQRQPRAATGLVLKLKKKPLQYQREKRRGGGGATRGGGGDQRAVLVPMKLLL
jgi:hypothetical protein